MARTRGPGLIAASALALCAAAALTPAKADVEWTWNYVNVDANITASGTLATKDEAGGAYQIIAIKGDWNGAPINGLEPVKSCCSPPGWNDNLLRAGAPKLDKAGLAFSVSGGARINLFFKDGHYAYEIERGPEVFGGAFTAGQVGR
ncbi:hypothetical protein [Methylocapsa palsarum]|uniref:Lipoprotein n=1 Tax=Methylocapsa palsarum TaxID=1612308 RepID=A0A1I3ZLT9_9HYPH|nr:hypothetical protein [Methylocapsa palsarum]SFK45044.1 hypothetical protein SAMN05444581_10843 [Methylocapsa palsarum]